MMARERPSLDRATPKLGFFANTKPEHGDGHAGAIILWVVGAKSYGRAGELGVELGWSAGSAAFVWWSVMN
jgi:hypothetical protein